MPFFVYFLRCADGSYYVGHTDDLESRINQHDSGLYAGYTRSRLPVTLVYSQLFPTRLEALAAERQIKRWSRAKKEALIANDWDRISQLGRRRKRRTE